MQNGGELQRSSRKMFTNGKIPSTTSLLENLIVLSFTPNYLRGYLFSLPVIYEFKVFKRNSASETFSRTSLLVFFCNLKNYKMKQ